jgi:hypothetical protein
MGDHQHDDRRKGNRQNVLELHGLNLPDVFSVREQTMNETKNPMHELDPNVNSLYSAFKGRINWDNLIPTCIDMARELEQMTHMKGPQRLELLQKTLRYAVQDSDMSDPQKEATIQIIDTVVPLAMQAAILASKIPIKRIQSVCCWKTHN